MRDTFTQLYAHVVWATWDRLPLITAEIEAAVYACIRSECHQLKCETIAVGGIEDHVHVLVRMPATLTVADLVKQVKGSSSHLITHRLPQPDAFKWQGAYSAFSVSKHDLSRIRAYIERQREHHAERTLLNDFEIP